MIKEKTQALVRVLGSETNALQVADKLEVFVNNMSADTKGFVEALSVEEEMLKERFSIISLLWVKKLNFFNQKGWYDLRNEFSVLRCAKISDKLGADLREFHPEYNGFQEYGVKLSFEQAIVEELGVMHRTLQQTFSELVFLWLNEMKSCMESEFFVEISKKGDLHDDFRKTPFI